VDPETIDTQIQILQSDTLVERSLKNWAGLTNAGTLGRHQPRCGMASDTAVVREGAGGSAANLLKAARRTSRCGRKDRHASWRSGGFYGPEVAADFMNTISNSTSCRTWSRGGRHAAHRGLAEPATGGHADQAERSHEKLQEYARQVGLVITEKQGGVVERSCGRSRRNSPGAGGPSSSRGLSW
jgi:hypothetical protein